jgi:hypothetical protein
MPTAEIETTSAPLSTTMPKVDDLSSDWSESHWAPATLPLVRASSEAPSEVSVVIPTRGRALLAVRAVRSALAQSFQDFEIVVVIDGPDPETSEAMRQCRDERLHVVQLGENVGGSEARNIGVRFARGKWIALLDDDDEWFPDKLEKQWKIGCSMMSRYAFVACRFIERTEAAERVLPRRLPVAGEIFSEYLFARRGWQSGEGFLQTSTWFVSSALMLKVPFYAGSEALPGPGLAAACLCAARGRDPGCAGDPGGFSSRREPSPGESFGRLEISLRLGDGEQELLHAAGLLFLHRNLLCPKRGQTAGGYDKLSLSAAFVRCAR